MATNYQRGAAFERRVCKDMEERGWFAMRSPGSKGHADVVAIGEECVLAIQCKTNGRCDPGEWNALYGFARRYGMVPIIAEKDERGHIAYRKIAGMKARGVRNPSEPFSPWVYTDEGFEDEGC